MRLIRHVSLSIMMLITCTLYSCSGYTFSTSSVAYQSIRSAVHKSEDVPKDAEIYVVFSINEDGTLNCVVANLTDVVMLIDQTKSFLINANGSSICYYDPTIHTTTTIDITSGTTGVGVNLGSIGNALGVGGAVGSMLNGINVGGSKTSGTSTSNTTYSMDQLQINLGPKGTVIMDKEFKIYGLLNLM